MSADCRKCNRAVRGNMVSCKGGCNGIFHQNCLELSESDVKMVITKNFVMVLCDKCQLKLHSVDTLFESINDIKNSVESNKLLIEKILQKIDKVECKDQTIIGEIKKVMVENNNSKSLTFAGIVKGDQAILVKPKNKQNVEITKKDIKKNINPVGLQVSTMKNHKDGAIIVACENQKSFDKLKNDAEVNLSDNYSVNILKSKNPRVMINNISEEMSENELIQALKLQNDFLTNSEITVKTIKKSNFKKYNAYSAVIEVNTETYNEIIKYGKLCVRWDKCAVKDATFVKRCYKCLGFNHTSSVCANKEKVCFKCGGNHVGTDCTEKEESCINCMKVNRELGLKLDCHHHAFDKNCQVYQRKLNIEKQKYY